MGDTVIKTQNKGEEIMMKEEDTLWSVKDSFIWGTSEYMQRKVEGGNIFQWI